MIGLLTENLGYKLLSLAVAVALWLSIAGERDLITSVSAPVQFRNIPKNLEISSEVPDRVHLEVKGPSSKVGASDMADVTVGLDLSAVERAGERTFTIGQNQVNLPFGVSLSRAIPGQVRLRFERTVTRDVPVIVRLAGPPPPGYRIARQDSVPDAVKIAGPESRVLKVAGAETDPIDLTGVAGEREFHVSTFVGDPQVRLQRTSEVSVRVKLERIP